MDKACTSRDAAKIRLRASWEASDTLLVCELGADAALSQPILLRRPFIFYLGHLPAFARRIIQKIERCADAKREYFDIVFERGIDPDIEDATICHKHPTPPPTWPEWNTVIEYRDRVRNELRSSKLPAAAIHLIAEHDVMHVETLQYMLAQKMAIQPPRSIVTEKGKITASTSMNATVRNHTSFSTSDRERIPVVREILQNIEWLSVPGGIAVLGRERDETVSDGLGEGLFAWDNEFPCVKQDVSAFEVAKMPVTICQYLKFINAGGYKRSCFWLDNDWSWIERERMHHPASLRCSHIPHNDDTSDCWSVVTVDGLVTVKGSVLDWPVSVSLAEARAFARFVGARLLTESEWDRTAFNGDEMKSDDMPWGGKVAVPGRHGNFGFWSRAQVPVGKFAQGMTWIGALDMYGNGWELVDTVFETFPGFVPMSLYEEYSVDFTDGKHFVLKGASWATEVSLVRRSFRNFFQAHYPFVFSKFRLARTI